jgi:hypothetical protein
MKTFVRSLMMIASVTLVAAGCAEDEPSDLTQSEEALLTCDGWHKNGRGHWKHRHHRHRHHHHHHHGKGGSGGSAGMTGTGGMSGGAGTMGTAGMMGGGGSGGTMGGGGTGGTPDPRCDEVPSTVSWWHGDGDFDDAVGANDGAPAGVVTFVPGFDDLGFGLSGTSNSFVEVPNDPSLQITGGLTMDAWINQTALGGRIIDKVTAFNVDGYLLDIVGDRLRLFMGGEWVLSDQPIPLGTFTHVAGVYDGSSFAVYVNGVLSNQIPTAIASVPVSANPLRIGADSTGGSLFNGVIDEPRIFNRALSAAEIATLFYQGSNCR